MFYLQKLNLKTNFSFVKMFFVLVDNVLTTIQLQKHKTPYFSNCEWINFNKKYLKISLYSSIFKYVFNNKQITRLLLFLNMNELIITRII